jgi:hypothetical protein
VARITRCVAFALAVGLPASATAVECAVEVQPPVLAPEARDGHRDRSIFGWQLMTHEERADLLARLREARAPAERTALRQHNYDAMVARARERGVVLPAGRDGARANDDRRIEPAPPFRRCSPRAQ